MTGAFDARTAPRTAQVGMAEDLADRVALRLGERVRLVVHDNASTMISFRRRQDGVHLRVHHLFLGAPDQVAAAIADFAAPRATARRGAGRRLDEWIRARRSQIGPPRLGRLSPSGSVHDLQAIFDRLNAEEFGGKITARIGWGRLSRLRGRRSIKMGIYLHEARAIRIHPALDRTEVPHYFVEAVVFHEMLHQAIPTVEVGGRRVVHGKEFRRREAAFRGHESAKLWERENLHRLLAAGGRRRARRS